MKFTPLALIAELTHRCPLHCVYCSNPIQLQKMKDEIDTATWMRVIDEAAQMGIVQLHLTGGEPTLRDDLVALIAHGRKHKLYSNLITSGVGLTEARLREMAEAGLDHIQLSLQDSQENYANEYAGTKAHAIKLKTAQTIKKFSLAFTINIVIHRQNISRLNEMISLGETLGADRMEIAHVQYYGWAFKNRNRLIPTSEQVKSSMDQIYAAKERLKDKLRIDFAIPDYFAKYPKPCMGGWGQKSVLIDPNGRVLPCHSAMVIPDMQFENIKEKSLSEIWNLSEAFERFRGEAWMQEPCSSCDRRSKDFGGCRCQAFLITGDAAATDPVCSLSPSKHKITSEIQSAHNQTQEKSWAYRKIDSPNS